MGKRYSMKKTNTVTKAVLILALALGALLFVAPAQPASAAVHDVTCDNGQTTAYESLDSTASKACEAIGSTYGSSASPQGAATPCDTKDPNCVPIIRDIQVLINFLAAGVMVVIVIMFIIAGLQYITAGDNPQTVAEARKKILNAVIALAVFIFLYSFLQFIVPGGIY